LTIDHAVRCHALTYKWISEWILGSVFDRVTRIPYSVDIAERVVQFTPFRCPYSSGDRAPRRDRVDTYIETHGFRWDFFRSPQIDWGRTVLTV
jgi:hypothetical protein